MVLQEEHAMALEAKSQELQDLAAHQAAEMEAKLAELAAASAAKVGGCWLALR